MATKIEIVQEYSSSLRDLCFNSKPMIMFLTQLAAENAEYAEDIFEAIKMRLLEAPINVKLPIVYLLDSIIRNVGGTYTTLFCKEIVAILHQVYFEVDQQSQEHIFKLRQKWNDVLPPNTLKLLDNNLPYFNSARLLSSSNTFNSTATELVSPLMSQQSSFNPPVVYLQLRIIEIQKEILDIQQRKLNLAQYESQLQLQQEHIRQNTKMACRTSTTSIYNSKVNTNNGEWKRNSQGRKGTARQIRDPRLLRRQQQSSVAMPNVPLTNSRFPESGVPNKNYQNTFFNCNSSTIFSKRFLEDVQLPVSKKIKREVHSISL